MIIKKTCCIIGVKQESVLSSILKENQQDCIFLKKALKKLIIRMIEDYKVTYFISAMRLGAEQLAAEIIIELKTLYPYIKLECVIPYENLAENWSEEQRDRYFNIMSKNDIETLLQYHYSIDCNKVLIKYLMGNSQLLLAVGNVETGKIGKVVKYAKSIGKIVVHINPETMEIIPDIKLKK